VQLSEIGMGFVVRSTNGYGVANVDVFPYVIRKLPGCLVAVGTSRGNLADHILSEPFYGRLWFG
jgi:hypothetical protein